MAEVLKDEIEPSACKSCRSTRSQPFIEVRSRYRNLKVQAYKSYRCDECGLIYVHPDPPASDLEQIYGSADYLDPLLDNIEWRTWVVPKHWSPVLKTIESKIGRGKILDVGCSDGLFMDIAEQQGWDVFGIDVNREKLRRAQQNHPDSARYGSIYELDWPDGYFDAVRLCHVLEHLNEPKEALMSLHRVLRTGGILNVGVPVLDDSIYWWLKRLPRSRFFKKIIQVAAWIDPPHHLTTWSTRSLQRILEDCGFKLIYKSYRSDIFPWSKGLRQQFLFFRALGVPMKILRSGPTIEVLAAKL